MNMEIETGQSWKGHVNVEENSNNGAMRKNYKPNANGYIVCNAETQVGLRKHADTSFPISNERLDTSDLKENWETIRLMVLEKYCREIKWDYTMSSKEIVNFLPNKF